MQNLREGVIRCSKDNKARRYDGTVKYKTCTARQGTLESKIYAGGEHTHFGRAGLSTSKPKCHRR
jgi:hypothetical protein